jgi:nucleoside-triphosphatase THEP1
MIHIVTGKINSGKTTTILELYNTIQKGDGIISVKRMQHDIVHGYDLLRLSDYSTRPFVMHERFFTGDKSNIACQIGPYLFRQDILSDIEAMILLSIEHGISPIYLDEIGVLELQGQCFASILKTIVKQDVEAYITVREDLVEDVISTFKITNYHILPV